MGKKCVTKRGIVKNKCVARRLVPLYINGINNFTLIMPV